MPTPSVQDADRLARGVLRQRLHVRPKETVTIESYPASLPWAAGFVRESRRLGARPLVIYEDEASYWTGVDEGHAAIVGSPGAPEWAALAASDVYIYFWGPEDMGHRNRLPPRQREQLTAFNSKWYDVARKSGIRGARMGIARVTPSNARLFGVPEARWRDQVLTASLRDPAQLRPLARRIARRMEDGRTVRIRHPNGTDLRLGLASRRAIVTIGEVTAEDRKLRFGMMASVPDGSVYVSVDESTADGTFVANRPTTTAPAGPLVGGRFTFREGRLTRASFERGGQAFRVPFRDAGRCRDRPAFLEVGLDPSLGGVPLLEEGELGAVTVGVGANAGFGGATRGGFLAYLTLAGAELTIDDRVVVRRGRPVGG